MRRSPRIVLTRLAVIAAIAFGAGAVAHSSAELGHALASAPVAQSTP